MKGTRKYPNKEGQLLLAEGEYGKDNTGTWYARPPSSHIGSLSQHTVVEHEDGTITVSPSILVSNTDSQWHGYLEKGIWRKA